MHRWYAIKEDRLKGCVVPFGGPQTESYSSSFGEGSFPLTTALRVRMCTCSACAPDSNQYFFATESALPTPARGANIARPNVHLPRLCAPEASWGRAVLGSDPWVPITLSETGHCFLYYNSYSEVKFSEAGTTSASCGAQFLGSDDPLRNY